MKCPKPVAWRGCLRCAEHVTEHDISQRNRYRRKHSVPEERLRHDGKPRHRWGLLRESAG